MAVDLDLPPFPKMLALVTQWQGSFKGENHKKVDGATVDGAMLNMLSYCLTWLPC